MRTGIVRRGSAAVEIAGAEHAAGFGIGLRLVGEEHLDAGVDHVLAACPERIGEPARGLELDERLETLGFGGRGALLPPVGSIVAGGGIDEAERRGAGRISRRKGERDAAPHGGARDNRAAPAHMIEQVGEVGGELLDTVGARRFVGPAVAATVIGEHRGGGCKRRRDRVPEAAVHAEGMDQHQRHGLPGPARDLEDEPGAVANFHGGSAHRHIVPNP